MKQNHERARGQGRIPAERLGHSLSVMAEVSMRDLYGHLLLIEINLRLNDELRNQNKSMITVLS